jgi:hypothetical protein
MMKRLRQIVFALVLLGMATPAHAQLLDIMDWIERMSGPALPPRFWLDVPFLCRYVDDRDLLDEMSRHGLLIDQKDPGPLRVFEAPRPRYPSFVVDAREEEAVRTSQGRLKFAPRQKRLLPCSPAHFGRNKDDRIVAAFRRRIVLNVRVANYNANHDGDGWFYGDNNLIYDASVPESDQTIHVFAFGPSIHWAVHPKVDLLWALEFNRFSGPAFESFWEPSIDVVGVAYRPFDREGRTRWLRFWQITLRTKKYLGTLEDVDFGAIPDTFRSSRESIVSLGLSYDISRIIWPGR